MKSMIYFVKIGGCIKIGWTRAIENRLPQLSANARLLAYFPGNRATEAQIHRALRHAHISGELFREQETKAYLHSLGFGFAANPVFVLPARKKRPNPYRSFSIYEYAAERNKSL